MSADGLSRRTRWFVGTGGGFLLAWGIAEPAGAGRGVGIALGIYGFVLHTVFGKAYSLVPSYFDRSLSTPRAPAVQFPLSALGTAGLAAGALEWGPDLIETAGAVAWGLGAAIFVGAIAWSVRDNLAGAETETGDHNAERRPIDRAANAFVPVALGYLLTSVPSRSPSVCRVDDSSRSAQPWRRSPSWALRSRPGRCSPGRTAAGSGSGASSREPSGAWPASPSASGSRPGGSTPGGEIHYRFTLLGFLGL